MEQALAQSVSDVLEKMFFLEALADTEEPSLNPAGDLSIRLHFHGDPPGQFRLRLARSAADAIAADFLGEDPDTLSAGQSQEVARELANMICGSLLSRIENRGSFKLSAPEVVEVAALPGTGPGGETAYTVETGNGTLTAAISLAATSLEPQACLATEKSAS